jgi:DNA topoisomerase-2
MDDSMLSDSNNGASSDFAPPAKSAKAVKAKTTAPKKAAAPAKPRGRPPKDPSAPPKAKAPAKAKVAPKKKRKDDSDDENSDIGMDDDSVAEDDDALLADTPPKQKKAPATKKASGKPLASIANDSFDMMDGIDDSVPSGKAKADGASSKYQMVCSGPTIALIDQG